MPDPTDPTSPTGTPVIPPTVFKYVALVIAVALSVLGVLMGVYPAVHAYSLAFAIISAVAGVLGIASPGLRSAVKVVAALALGAMLLASTPARADVLYSVGPTIPLIQITPGDPHPVSIAPGAGVQLSLTMPQFQRAYFGKAWDMLDLELMAFGTLVNKPDSGQQFGVLSTAFSVCTLSSLVCLGAGKHMLDDGGVVSAKAGYFFLVSLGFNLALAPEAPPTGIATGAGGLARANTLYFGAP